MSFKTEAFKRILRRTLIHISDIILIVLSVYLAARLRYDGSGPVESYIVLRVLYSIPLLVFSYLGLTLISGANKITWRFADIRDMLKVLGVCACTAFLTLIINRIFDIRCPRLVISISSVIAFLFILTSRYIWILVQDFLFTDKNRKHVRRCIVIGANADGMRLARSLSAHSEDVRRVAVAFLDDDIELLYRKVDGLPVEGTLADVGDVAVRKYIDEVVLSGAKISAAQLRGVYMRTVCVNRRLLMRGDNDKLRVLTIEDALSIMTDSSINEAAENALAGDRYLVCGASSVVGRELVYKIAECKPESITLMDTDENALCELKAELGENARYVIGDAAEKDEFSNALDICKANRVFYLCGISRSEMSTGNGRALYKRNVSGVKNAYTACAAANAKSFTCLSTVNSYSPRNAVEASAALGERELLNASANGGTIAQTVRIDNVITSPDGELARMKAEFVKHGHITCRKDNARGFLPAGAAAADILAISALRPSGSYIIDPEDDVNLQELARVMARECKGKDDDVIVVDNGESDNSISLQKLAPTEIRRVFTARAIEVSDSALEQALNYDDVTLTRPTDGKSPS